MLKGRSKVIIEKFRGGRFLWNRNWDLGWIWAGWHYWKKKVWTNYEQLLRQIFTYFHGRKKKLISPVWCDSILVLKTRFITVVVIQVVVVSKIVFEINMLGSIGDIQLQNGYFMIFIYVQIKFPENLFDFSSFVVPCTHCIWIQDKKKYLHSSCRFLHIRIWELEYETRKKSYLSNHSNQKTEQFFQAIQQNIWFHCPNVRD